MSYDYFSQKLKPSDDREQLLYFAGMFEAFDDLILGCFAGTQPGFTDSDISPSQFIGFELSTDNSAGKDLHIHVLPDGGVMVVDRFTYPNPNGGEPIVTSEEHYTSIKNILNWLRTQSPKFHGYL
jgi:hypothetical protein